MKHFYAGLFLAGTLATMMVSCSGEDNPWNKVEGDGGKIHLSVTSDAEVLRSTRADDTKATIIPGPEEFAITLSRTDGSFTQKWGSLEAFNKETSFQMGEYTIEASFGNMETEGFDNPYFYASQTVNVAPGDERNVNLTATLANCMVSVRYTPEFTALFPQYSAAVRSTGHDYVVFAGNESRPAYMYPSQMALSITLTNSAGKQVTIQPASFTAQARRHYIVTIGVEGAGSQGYATLNVQFEENVVAETVDVSLGDELFDAPEPLIKTQDFPAEGEAMNTFVNLPVNNDPRYEVYAFGGLKEVNLSVSGSGSSYNPPFGQEVQLVNADNLTQSNVSASGLEVFGLFKNVDKMGVVKLKNFIEKLPKGNYVITLRATDALTREAEPVSLNVEISPVNIKIEPVKNPAYMTNTVEVYVSTNCPDIRNKSTFTITNENLDATIKNIENLTASPINDLPASYVYHYKYTLEAPRNLGRDGTPVKLYYGSNADPHDITYISLDYPKFTATADPFANDVKLKIEPEDPAMLNIIMNNIVIMNNGSKILSGKVNILDAKNGILSIEDWKPETNYNNVVCKLTDTSNPTIAEVKQFTTESEAKLTNGDFSQTTQTVNFSDIQVGGQYSVSPVDYTLKSSIVRDTPNGWATLNPLTCYSGSSNKNTWYMVPSAFSEGGTIIIRSVGYNHNGKDIPRSGGAFNTKYYCENSPADADLMKSPGEVFLGSYSYNNGKGDRTDGIPFTSRPLSVKFKYRYKPLDNDNGVVTIKAYDSDGNVIMQRSANLTTKAALGDTQTTVTIPIANYAFGKKAAKLMISFKSSNVDTPSIKIPTGKELNEGQGLGNHTLSANSYKAFAMGSELEIDDVELGY